VGVKNVLKSTFGSLKKPFAEPSRFADAERTVCTTGWSGAGLRNTWPPVM